MVRSGAAATAAAMAAHRAAGDRVVLVTGSFRPVLDPLMADLGADLALCSEPVIDALGRYTGDVPTPMIGRNKTAAVRSTMAALGVDPARCAAYGDHHTDLGMLQAVGHPRVIANDPALQAVAATAGWPVLPATAGPHPTAHLLPG